MHRQGAGKSTRSCPTILMADPGQREPLVPTGMRTVLSLCVFYPQRTRTQLAACGYITNERVMTNEFVNDRDNRESEGLR